LELAEGLGQKAMRHKLEPVKVMQRPAW